MSEAQEQKIFIEWFKEHWPQYIQSIRVSAAGLPRHGKKGAIQWAMMKGQGIQPGEADISILLARGTYHCMVIEHKTLEDKRKTPAEQQKYIDYHNSIDNFATFTHGIAELKTKVHLYMED